LSDLNADLEITTLLRCGLSLTCKTYRAMQENIARPNFSKWDYEIG
jgi:hypothetical protein